MPDIFSTIPSPLVTVIGEALIDLIPNGAHHEYRALPGGSPFNVAVGLARLGNRIQLLARLSDNVFGRILRDYAENEGIDLSQAPHAIEPTSLAVVSIGDAKRKIWAWNGCPYFLQLFIWLTIFPKTVYHTHIPQLI